MIKLLFKISDLLNKITFYYLTKSNKIGKYILSYEAFFMIISQFKTLKDSKIYNLLKLFFKLIIYFNIFILSTDLILKYEYDEIYTILFNIYNDIIKYLKKLYIVDKLENLINDNSIDNDNSI